MKTLVTTALIMFNLSGAFAQRDTVGGHESGGRLSANAVYVDFYSPGNGIDSKSKRIVDDLINKALEEGVTLETWVSNIGREGEVTLCVNFVDANKRYNFIKSIAPSIKSDRAKLGIIRTAVKVGLDCSDVNRATEQDLNAY